MPNTYTYNSQSRLKLMLAGQVEKLLTGFQQFCCFVFDSGGGVHRFNGNAAGADAFAESRTAHATGERSHAEGYETTSSGIASHAEGSQTEASEENAHAEGTYTEASGIGSHAEGNYARANNGAAHAEGIHTRAYGLASHAEGYYTYAQGANSHVEGEGSNASGDSAHAEGYYTKAGSDYQSVEGKFNVEDTQDTYAHIIGDGTDDSNRHNLMTVDWDGNVEISGDMKVGGCTSNGDTNYPVMRYNTDRNVPEYNDGTEWSFATPEGFVYGGARVWDNSVTSREIVVPDFSKVAFMNKFHVKSEDEVDDCYCNFVNGDMLSQNHRILATSYRSNSGWAMYLDSAASVGKFRVCYLVFVPKTHSSI